METKMNSDWFNKLFVNDVKQIIPKGGSGSGGSVDTSAVLEELKNTGGIGYSVKKDDLVFDGNIGDRHTIPGDILDLGDNMVLVKITDEVVSVEDIDEIDFYDVFESVTIPIDEIVVQKSGGASLLIYKGAVPLVGIIPEHASSIVDAPAGIYVICTVEESFDSMYVSSIRFKENISGIDPKFLPEGGFGYVGGDRKTITFDGDITGLTYYPMSANMLTVKVSDDVVELDKFLGLTLLDEESGTSTKLSVAELSVMAMDIGYSISLYDGGDPYMMVIRRDYSGFPKGTWIMRHGDNSKDYGFLYPTEIVYGDETVHRIDPKFLPEGGVGYETSSRVTAIEPGTYTFTDGSNGEFIFSFVEGDTVIVNYEGEEYVRTAARMIVENMSITYAGNLYPLSGIDTGEPFCAIVLTDGTTIMWDIISFSESTGSDYSADRELYMIVEHKETGKIDPKFLPEGGFGYSKEIVLTNDGNNEGKEYFELQDMFTFVRIGDCIDLTKVTELRGEMNGVNMSVESRDLILDDSEMPYFNALAGEYNGDYVTLVVCVLDKNSIFGANTGTYVLSTNIEELNAKVTEVVLGENISRIDPKFLPEGGVGYVDAGPTVLVIDDKTVTFESGMYQEPLLSIPEPDANVSLIIDGNNKIEGKLEAYDAEGIRFVYFGNTGLLDSDLPQSSNDNFAIGFLDGTSFGEGYLLAIVLGDEVESGETIHSISLSYDAMEIHTIDPKYTPGVLPIVELTTATPSVGSTVTLSEEEASMLRKAAATGMPMIIRMHLGQDDITAGIFSVSCSSEGIVIYGNLFVHTVNITYSYSDGLCTLSLIG